MKTKLLLYGSLVVGIVGMMPSASLASSSDNPCDSPCRVATPVGVMRTWMPLVAKFIVANGFVSEQCPAGGLRAALILKVLHDCSRELLLIVEKVNAFLPEDSLPKDVSDSLYKGLDAIKSSLNVVNSQLTKLGMEAGEMERASVELEAEFSSMSPDVLKSVLGAVAKRTCDEMQ